MSKKQVDIKKRNPQTFIEAATDFEKFKIEEIKKSRKIAWVISALCAGVTTISILAFLVALLIRPEPEPVIIKVDNSTGASEVLRSIKDTENKYDEVINKYWLAKYVQLREGYDWFTIGSQYEAVRIMSNPNIFDRYNADINSKESPVDLYKDRFKIEVHVTAITFIHQMAQVRFTSERKSINGENKDNSPKQKWIATIAFQFDAGYMTDQERLVNPLGFKIVSYKVDSEAVQ